MQALCEQYSDKTAPRELWLHMWSESVEPLCRQEGPCRSTAENGLVWLDYICVSSLFSCPAQNSLNMFEYIKVYIYKFTLFKNHGDTCN